MSDEPIHPVVVAHRANVAGPSLDENTLTAVAAAAAAGADAVELDVRRTVDGHLVLGHDPIQWRQAGRVRLPYIVRFTPRGRLRFLADFDEAVDCALDAGLHVKLDVKDSAIVTALRTHCRNRQIDPARVALWCRSPAQVAEPANHDVFAEVALLARTQGARRYVAEAAQAGATAVSLNPNLLDAASVSSAHDLGLTVYAWIVDHRHERAVDLGCDGLVTDWVEPARRAAGSV